MLIPKHQIEGAKIQHFISRLKNLAEKQALVEKWIKIIETGKIAKRKEESIKADFIADIFTGVLGYSASIERNKWQLEKELKTTFDGKKPDISIGYFSQDSSSLLMEDVRAVVEIKGPNVNLDSKQNRKDFKGSPIEQGFNYAYRIGDNCKWVIVTNFLKIRLYRASDINKYEEFRLSELRNQEALAKFLFFLSSDQLFLETEPSILERLYLGREKELKSISNEFYLQYHELREQLFFNLSRQNPKIEWKALFGATQKIIDRIIFICFVKDLKLVSDVLNEAKRSSETSFDQSRTNFWRQLLMLFDALDKGFSRKNIPPFNGGLFKNDALIQSLEITDEQILEFVDFAMKYNFHSQLDVNILGHIFEQSISDLEQLKENIQTKNPILAGELEKLEVSKLSKRKKDGIYYTPDFITKYIVREAVGGWLDERKQIIIEEFGVSELPEATQSDYETIGSNENTTILLLINYYERYRESLQSIKVLDPACGSGAFLTQVFDFLFEQWRITEEELIKLQTPFQKRMIQEMDPFGNGLRNEWEIKKNIIVNNLYGVDLNLESVEITKLSLWLKTANRKNSLATLTDNIKQGNSLIDDPKVVGDDAFNWENEFPDILKNGGFDVVVGNPPYFSLSKSPELTDYFEKGRYETYLRGTDIYVLFYELGINLLQKGGNLSFITSNSWVRSNYGAPMKKFIKSATQPISLLEIEDKQLFEDAVVESNIFVLKKQAYEKPLLVRQLKNTIEWTEQAFDEFPYELPQDENWVFGSETTNRLKEKIEANATLLGELEIEINYGIKTGLNEAFIIDEVTKNKITKADPKSEEIIKPILRGRDISRYQYDFSDLWVIESEFKKADSFQENYQAASKHLSKFKKKLKERGQVKNGQHHWIELDNNPTENYLSTFSKPKIIWGEISDKPKFTFEKGDYYQEATTFIMTGENLKFILGILNSKLSEWYFHLIGTTTGMGTNRWKKYKIEQFPIVNALEKEKKSIEALVNKMLKVKSGSSEMRKSYLTILTANFPAKKPLSNKLKNNLWSMEFVDVLVELEKSGITIPARKQKEWLELFHEERTKARKLQTEIEKTEKEIDQLVYQLYGLTQEEIGIIEEEVK